MPVAAGGEQVVRTIYLAIDILSHAGAPHEISISHQISASLSRLSARLQFQRHEILRAYLSPPNIVLSLLFIYSQRYRRRARAHVAAARSIKFCERRNKARRRLSFGMALFIIVSAARTQRAHIT